MSEETLQRFLLAAALALASCTSAPKPKPVASVDARGVLVAESARRFPAREFIVGFGSATSPQDAEERARVDAAGTIRSEIQANLTAIQKESSVGGSAVSTVQVTEEIVRRTQTDAGALIQPVRELTQRIDGRYEAVAVARRADLDERYAAESEQLVRDFLAAVRRANDAAAPHAAALCEARTLAARLDRLDVERRLVTRRSGWTEEALEGRRVVDALRDRAKATPISVVRGADELEGDVSKALVTRLSRAGYGSGLVERPSCDAGGALVRFAVERKCGKDFLGQRCDLSLSATSTPCGSERALFQIRSEPVIGRHATDAELAGRLAIQNFGVEPLADAVAARLLGALEGECTP